MSPRMWNESVEVPRKKRDEALTEFTKRSEDGISRSKTKSTIGKGAVLHPRA